METCFSFNVKLHSIYVFHSMLNCIRYMFRSLFMLNVFDKIRHPFNCRHLIFVRFKRSHSQGTHVDGVAGSDHLYVRHQISPGEEWGRHHVAVCPRLPHSRRYTGERSYLTAAIIQIIVFTSLLRVVITYSSCQQLWLYRTIRELNEYSFKNSSFCWLQNHQDV